MRPNCDYILNTSAMLLATKFMPQIKTEIGQKELGLTALLLGVVSEEFDRAASRRIEENRGLRKLFSEAIPVVEDLSLKDRLKEAAGLVEEDFRISALDKLNSDLLSIFIDLHSHIETLEGEDARRIEEAIWEELAAYTKRRELAIWELASTLLAASDQNTE